MKGSPRSPHKSREGGKHRSPTSLSLLGSLVRALKVKPHKKSHQTNASSPLLKGRRSLPGLDTFRTGGWEPVRSVYTSPRCERERMIEEWRHRQAAKERTSVVVPPGGVGMMALDRDGDCGLAGEGDDEMDISTGPAQYLYVPTRRASIGGSPVLTPRSASSLHVDPFRTPPCSPKIGPPKDDVSAAFGVSESTDCLESVMSSAPLSAVDNTINSETMRRRRAEKSRMKSLQILGPEAVGVIGDFQ